MPRDVTDAAGIIWTCIQAFSGLGKDPEKMEAARVDGEPDAFQVVCTPSGGAQSVRIEMPGGWEEQASDDQLLEAIEARSSLSS